MTLKKHSIPEVNHKEEKVFNMGIATLERINDCFLMLRDSLRAKNMGVALEITRELLTEVDRMIPETPNKKIAKIMDEINDIYNPYTTTLKGRYENHQCFNYVYEIQKIVKGELWDQGFTMPTKQDVLSKGGA